MENFWIMAASVAFVGFARLFCYFVDRAFTPRLDVEHVSAVMDKVRTTPGVIRVDFLGGTITCDGSVDINVVDDETDWSGEAARISKELDPSGNLRIHIHILRHFPAPKNQVVYLESFHGLPRYMRFVVLWSGALVAAEFLIFWPLPIGQTGLLLAILGAVLLFIMEGGVGRPVEYLIEAPTPLPMKIKTMSFRMTGFLSIAFGGLLQFIAMRLAL